MDKNDNKSNLISSEDLLREIGIKTSKDTEINPTSKSSNSKYLDNVLKGNLNSQDNDNLVNDSENSQEDTLKKTVEEKNNLVDNNTDLEVKKEEEKALSKFGVRDTINSLIENDIWTDIAIKIGDKEYDSIDDLLKSEKPTKKLFDELSKLQKQVRDESLEKDYVSIKDKDETKVKLVSAILSGVEYDDLLKYNKQVIEPIKNLDFANQDERLTEEFVKRCLVDIDNVPPKYVDLEISEMKKNFTLIEKAESFREIAIKKYNEEIESRENQLRFIKEEEEKERLNNLKSFKKLLKQEDYSDSFIQKASQLRYTKDSSGLYHYEKLLQDKLKDDKFTINFIHFLIDEKDFLKKAKTEAKTETAKRMMELVNIVPRDKGSKRTETQNSLSTADENFRKKLGIPTS